MAYWKLTSYLKKWGFEANPYDLCVWNAVIDGSQMTIVFHVDDLKISHMKCSAIQVIIDKLNRVYGKREKMKVANFKSSGKVMEYLGMTLDYRVPDEVLITEYDQIQ